ncbi:MAG: hypothetical protein GY710_11945 [Desulfobacteraceae bacterium]|nr:hypothetical protein [Desulfobacteraceae bacterium]
MMPPAPDNGAQSRSARSYMDLVCKFAPAVQRTLDRRGHETIAAFTRNHPFTTGPGVQGKEDFFSIVHDFILPLLGPSIARRARADLEASPVLLTANHHGVDFFSQSVQGSLLFSLMTRRQNPKASTIPVMACANIPLNNLTYPRGILIYQTMASNLEEIPHKLPLFSDRLKSSVVSATGPIAEPQIQKALKRVATHTKCISSTISDTLVDILENVYAAPEIQHLSTYSEQSVVLNHKIWKRLYSDPRKAQDMIYLPLESIVAKLLEIDLHDPSSLISVLMFDPDVRQALMTALDGRRACWQEEKLKQRIEKDLCIPGIKRQLDGCGTHFFWGVDPRNRLVPMHLTTSGGNDMALKGKDVKGQIYRFSFDPRSIKSALRKKLLMPSLFTSYTTLCLARGITCMGGYYQSEYLPIMQKGVAMALKKKKRHDQTGALVEKIKAAHYLSVMQTVMTTADPFGLIPAGPVEIIAAGGMGKKEMRKIEQLSVRDAHLASLLETIPDVVPYNEQPKDWRRDIAAICRKTLTDKILVL